ncbi:hypothetical protein EYF80_009022 [Liparis tanakae]|uniref:Uncharacterized protein n=1 Tax=Liparis tanakae TaxID=230148 RepID=A0A4Z2IT65_9TELE|nr:hypothetical protein EYF80_009022 [Liparis tanakae]
MVPFEPESSEYPRMHNKTRSVLHLYSLECTVSIQNSSGYVHHRAISHSKVDIGDVLAEVVTFDTRLLLQLGPQLVALLHHLGVEVLLVGLADDARLAMGAASAVRQDKLER